MDVYTSEAREDAQPRARMHPALPRPLRQCVRRYRPPLRRAQVRSDGTTHITVWCGLILQHAYRAVLERGYSPPGGGVYISYYLYGSPAQKYKLVPKNWIVELNGSPVADLAGFVELVRELPHGANVRVKLVDLNGKTSAFSLKTDHNYWRGYAVHLAGEQWVLRALNEPPAAS